MIRCFVLATCLLATMAPMSTGLAASKKPPAASLSGNQVAKKMFAALGHQKHIVVKGKTDGGNTLYTFRFQHPDRESILETGPSFAHIQLGNKRQTAYHMISVGQTMYRSFDGSTWLKAHRASPASSADVVSLNAGNQPCCLPAGKQNRGVLLNRGTSRWHGHRVYLISFSHANLDKTANGTVYVDAHSFLPLYYTDTSAPPQTSGSFTITYGGSFNIRTPRGK